MKFAKKMVAITEDEYKKLRGCSPRDKLIKYKKRIAKKIVHKSPTVSLEGFFHPNYQSKVKKLLEELYKTGVKVTSNRELQLPYGDVIHGSDVVDLIKEFFVGTAASQHKPIGWKEFTNAVANSNAPLGMMSKAAPRSTVRKIRNETINWDEY